MLPKKFWMDVSEPTSETGDRSMGTELTEPIFSRKQPTQTHSRVTAIHLCSTNAAAITFTVAAASSVDDQHGPRTHQVRLAPHKVTFSPTFLSQTGTLELGYFTEVLIPRNDTAFARLADAAPIEPAALDKQSRTLLPGSWSIRFLSPVSSAVSFAHPI